MRGNETSVADVNQLILAKLQQYRPAVAALASQAVLLANDLPVDDVAESLEALLRDIARREELDKP